MPVLFVGAQASAAPPAGCDPSRPGVTHGADGANPVPADAVPCLTYAFFGFGEANPVVASSGAVMYGGAYFPTPQEVPIPAYEVSGNIARSVNKGGDWEFIPLPTDALPNPANPVIPSRGAGDPRLWRDPLTDRVFYTNIGGSYGWPSYPDPAAFSGLCQTEMSFTDDGGQSWTNNPDPQAWGCPAFDFPQPFTAPRTTSSPAPDGAYPNVLYICKSQVPGGRRCWKSLDSGTTLTELPGVGAHNPRTGGLDGTIYGVTGGRLHYSTDEAATWTVGAGVLPVTPSRDPAVDSAGNVYVVGTLNSRPQVTYSTDKGATWHTPIPVQMPGVNHIHHSIIAVPPLGHPGPVAVGYVGNGDASDTTVSPYNQAGGVHHGYIAVTDDIFAADPVFRSVQVDSDDEPLLPNGFPIAGNTTTPSRADYIGVHMDEPGALQIAQILQFFDQSVQAGTLVGSGPKKSAASRLTAALNMLTTASGLLESVETPWAYFYKDLCPTPGVCQCPKPGVCDDPNPLPIWTNWLGSVATVERAVTEGGLANACQQLKDALDRTDGNPLVPDFVTGSAAPGLASRIGALRGDLDCG